MGQEDLSVRKPRLILPERTRTLVAAYMELRGAAIGGPGDHIVMEPDDTETLDKTVVLPRGAYEALEAFVIAFPIKTSAKDKLHVAIVHQRNGGLWLQGSGDFSEDDDRTDFALIP